jgi:hypothetical protein
MLKKTKYICCFELSYDSKLTERKVFNLFKKDERYNSAKNYTIIKDYGFNGANGYGIFCIYEVY